MVGPLIWSYIHTFFLLKLGVLFICLLKKKKHYSFYISFERIDDCLCIASMASALGDFGNDLKITKKTETMYSTWQMF